MKHILSFLAVSVLALSAGAETAQAQDPHPEAEYRQSLMTSIRGHLGAAGAILGGNVSHEDQLLGHASALNDLATGLGDTFPEGTGGEGSRALPEIWASPEAFAEQIRSFREAAAGFLEAVQAGEEEAISQAFSDVRGSCRSCHGDFRARAN